MEFIKYTVVRLDNDVNGNPRYYISAFELKNYLGVSYDVLEVVRKKVGAKVYRGKKYGAGYVFASYNLDADVERMFELAIDII